MEWGGKVQRYHPDDSRQVLTVMAALHGGISSDPELLSSSIFSRSSNRQGQEKATMIGFANGDGSTGG